MPVSDIERSAVTSKLVGGSFRDMSIKRKAGKKSEEGTK
jgi:hypothetical protein